MPRPSARVGLPDSQDDYHREQAQGRGRQELPISNMCPAAKSESRDQANDEEEGMVVA